MSDEIDVSDIPPEKLLAGLFNASKQQGMGFLNPAGGQSLTDEAAREFLDQYEDGKAYFDYLSGRVMKVEINGKTLDPRLYDRDNGPGAAARVVESLR